MLTQELGSRRLDMQKPCVPAQTLLAGEFLVAVLLLQCCSMPVCSCVVGQAKLGVWEKRVLARAWTNPSRREEGQPEAKELENAPILGFVIGCQGLLLVCTLVFIAIHLSHEKSARICCCAKVAGLCRASLGGSQL